MRDDRNGIDELYNGAVTVAAVLIIAFGLLTFVITLVHDGGPTSVGFVVGLGFIILGSARLWLARRSS